MICDFFKRFDIFGKEIRFESGHKHRYTSVAGGIITILVILAIVILAFMFGSEVYERKTPRTNVSASFLEKSKIALSDYPLMVSFHKQDGTGIPDALNVFNFDGYHFVVDENTTPTVVLKNDVVKKCDPNDYSNDKKEYIANALDQYKDAPFEIFCIVDKDYYFENGYTLPNSAFIQLDIHVCDEEANKVCSKKTKEITNDRMYITFWFLDSTPTPDNYSSPIKFYKSQLTDEISLGLTTVKNLRFTNNLIISDEGWLLENKKEYHYIMLKNHQTNYVLKGGNNKLIFSLILESPSLRDQISRNYTKIQDICAQIGGIANFLFILTEILTSHYFEFKYKFYLFSFIHAENNIKEYISTNLNEENKGSVEISKFTLNKLKEENSKNNLIVLSNNNLKRIEEQKNENDNIHKQPENIINPPISHLNSISKILNEYGKNEQENNMQIDSIDLNKVSTNLEDYDSYYEFIISIICCNNNYKYVFTRIKEKADSIMSLEKYLNILKFTYTE